MLIFAHFFFIFVTFLLFSLSFSFLFLPFSLSLPSFRPFPSHFRPSAYSYYAIFEWSLVFIDVGYDTASVRDLRGASLQLDVPLPPAVKPNKPVQASFLVHLLGFMMDTVLGTLFGVDVWGGFWRVRREKLGLEGRN